MNGVTVQDERFQFNVSAFDGWSVVHVVVALTMGILRIPRPIAYTLIFATEIAELLLRKMLPFFRESAANIFTDLLIGISAYELGRAVTT